MDVDVDPRGKRGEGGRKGGRRRPGPHHTQRRLPLSESLAVPLVDVHSLVAVSCPPSEVVQVAHGLCLDLI